MIRKIFLPLLAAVVGALPSSLLARELPVARPESVGMSTERLARIDALLQRYVTSGQIVNAVTLVLRDGKVVQQGAYGNLDPNAGTPMRADFFLQITVRDFVAAYPGGSDAPVARVVLDCTLGRRLDRSVIAAFTAQGSAPAPANRMGEVVAAYEAALQQAMAGMAESLAAAAR